jgi:hypothetical protein
MAYYAKVVEGTVVNVIVADATFFDDFIDETPGVWLETSAETHGGVHSKGGTPIRKNYASIGYEYSLELDAFIAPQYYFSWTLNEETCLWEAPIPYPTDGLHYYWNEDTTSWVEVTEE